MSIRSFAVLSALLATVLAQATSNPYIPSGISVKCEAYLASLDNNTDLIACTNPFTTALQKFTPGTGATPTTADITTALGSLCQSNAFSGCPQNTITTQLSSFYAACSVELTSNPNMEVKTTYDVLYALYPLRLAMCSKDDSGKYCATQLSNTSSSGSVALVEQQNSQQQALLENYLYTTPGSSGVLARDSSSSQSALIPNVTTYETTNLLFMFLQPSMPASTLCTTCTRNIFTPYIYFESSCPYAPGMSNSLLLAGQVALYANITTKCGQGFLGGAVSAAGGISSGLLSGAAPLTVGHELSAAVGAILGVAAFVAASL